MPTRSTNIGNMYLIVTSDTDGKSRELIPSKHQVSKHHIANKLHLRINKVNLLLLGCVALVEWRAWVGRPQVVGDTLNPFAQSWLSAVASSFRKVQVSQNNFNACTSLTGFMPLQWKEHCARLHIKEEDTGCDPRLLCKDHCKSLLLSLTTSLPIINHLTNNFQRCLKRDANILVTCSDTCTTIYSTSLVPFFLYVYTCINKGMLQTWCNSHGTKKVGQIIQLVNCHGQIKN